MSKKDKSSVYHAFVDGSAYAGRSNSKAKYGVGGVIVHVNGRLRIQSVFSETIKGDHNTSLTCEMKAVSRALSFIPANSNVVVHSDLKDLCGKINGRGLADWFNGNDKPSLHESLDELGEQIARHDFVHASFTPEKKSKIIAAAHKLAQAGANEELLEITIGPYDKKQFALTKKTLAEELAL